MTAYIVETPVFNASGERVATFRHVVGSEERAVAQASEVPGRTWRAARDGELPSHVIERLEAAKASS